MERSSSPQVGRPFNRIVLGWNAYIALGGVVSDITVLEGVLKDGTHVFAYVPTKQPGISFKGDWDVIGQRLTVSLAQPS